MKQSRSTLSAAFAALFIVVVLGVYTAWALGRPLAFVSAVASPIPVFHDPNVGALIWPAVGQAAIGINPSGVLASHGVQTAIPIASTAKVLTALAVLKKHPLPLHQPGPMITISPADVVIFNNYKAVDGSVTAIQNGEKLTQYQMLQAILLPSANNIADSLAIWAFGSLDNYAAFTNGYIRQLGLTHTVVGKDASGYDPSTVGTAHDLVLLGEAAMQEPVLAEIVGQTSADLPVAGKIQNVNFLLGSDGIVGVKTGNTDQAGGVFLAAKKIAVSGQKLTLITAVVGSPTLATAFADTLPLLKSGETNFTTATIIPAGTVVGRYTAPWGQSVSAVTGRPLSTVLWKGSTVTATSQLQPIYTGFNKGQIVGSMSTAYTPVNTAQNLPVVLQAPIKDPSIRWRLTHPFKN